MTLNEFCDGVYCINLPGQKKRKILARREFDSYKINVKWRDGVLNEKYPHIGCRQAHQNILIEAKARGLKRILIFEDDIILAGTEIIEKALDNIPESWDLLYLGCKWGSRIKFNNHWDKVLSCKLNHATIFHESIFDIVINSNKKSMDQTSLMIHPRGKSYCVCPIIAFQRI